MNTNIVHLQCFLAVASTKSFTKAALKVGLTQSAISQKISKLEVYLDTQLFMRDRHMTLTHSGEIFQQYAQEILSLHHELFNRIKTPTLEGQVRFGFPEDFAALFLDDVLSDFVQIHPRILLNIECDLTINLFERFKKKEFDMVLVKMSQPEDFPNGLEIHSEKLEWVSSQDFALKKLEEKQCLPLVLSPHPCVYRARAINALESASIKWQIFFGSTSYTSRISAVRAGLGLTVLPKTMIPKQLKILDKTYLPKLEDTHMSLLKHNEENPVVNSFEAFVLKKLEKVKA